MHWKIKVGVRLGKTVYYKILSIIVTHSVPSSYSTTSDDYDSVSLFSNSSFITNVSNEAPKRKRQDFLNSLTSEELQNLQQKYKLSRPRIIKSDFRRNFPAMWVNVFNSCSYEYLLRHINTFYEPDVTMQQRDLRPCKHLLRCVICTDSHFI